MTEKTIHEAEKMHMGAPIDGVLHFLSFPVCARARDLQRLVLKENVLRGRQASTARLQGRIMRANLGWSCTTG